MKFLFLCLNAMSVDAACFDTRIPLKLVLQALLSYMGAVERRPWGRFEQFTKNEPCTVKLIFLDADKQLSLQYHNNRTEFWKVIQGPIKVQLEKESRILKEGESILIPKKAVHRLMSAGVPAVVLEISMGNFDEADIVRLEDDYRR